MQILCAREAVVAVLAPHGSPAPGYGGGGGGSDMKKAGEAEAGNSNSATMTPAGTLTLDATAEVRMLDDWTGRKNLHPGLNQNMRPCVPF